MCRSTSPARKLAALAVNVTPCPVVALGVRVALGLKRHLRGRRREEDHGIQRPAGMPRARELVDRVPRVDEVHHIRRLDPLQPRQIRDGVRGDVLLRRAPVLYLPVIHVDAEVEIPELEDVRLRIGEFERDQPRRSPAIFVVRNVVRPRSPRDRPMREGDEVLQRLAGIPVALDVNAPIEAWRELARRDGRLEWTRPRHSPHIDQLRVGDHFGGAFHAVGGLGGIDLQDVGLDQLRRAGSACW